jgi:hypothetical protein
MHQQAGRLPAKRPFALVSRRCGARAPSEETMRQNLKRATGAVATAANLLALSAADPVAAGQTRGSLSVTVRVVAACGGSVGTGGTTQQSEGCAPRQRADRRRQRGRTAAGCQHHASERRGRGLGRNPLSHADLLSPTRLRAIHVSFLFRLHSIALIRAIAQALMRSKFGSCDNPIGGLRWPFSAPP